MVFGLPASPAIDLLPSVGGAAFAQAGCYGRSYEATTILVCPRLRRCQFFGVRLACQNIGRFKAYCATNPGIPPCAAFAGSTSGGGGGGGGRHGGNGNGASNPPPTPGNSIDDDADVVKNCARQHGRDLFTQVAGMGAVAVRYRDTGPRIRGTARWLGDDQVAITINGDLIASVARRRRTSYWYEFAHTLLHEYHHARDMLDCSCGNPHEEPDPPMSVADYERATDSQAVKDRNEIASCLPD